MNQDTLLLASPATVLQGSADYLKWASKHDFKTNQFVSGIAVSVKPKQSSIQYFFGLSQHFLKLMGWFQSFVDQTSSMQLKIFQAMSTIVAALDYFNFCPCQSEVMSLPAPSPKENTLTFLKSPAGSSRLYAEESEISVATLLMPFWDVIKAQIPKVQNNAVLRGPQVNQRKLSYIKREFMISYLTENKPSRVTTPCTVWQGMKPWMQQPLNY